MAAKKALGEFASETRRRTDCYLRKTQVREVE